MFAQNSWVAAGLMAWAGLALVHDASSGAETPPPNNLPAGTDSKSASGNWRPPAATASSNSAVAPAAPSNPAESQPPLQSVRPPSPRQPIARVTKGPGTLPNEAGQEWHDYDISPYTARVTSTNRPEQAIVDWILRETGYEAWHSEPLGVLSANRRILRVYHTPEMHTVVGEMVDRFVNSEAETHAFGLRVITVGNPGWRAKAQRMMRPVSAQSQGVQAWILAKEDAALLLADLRKRSDFREHNTPHLLVNNGQSTIVSATRPRNYVRNVSLRSDVWPGFEPEMAQFDEGFSLEFNPLLSLDGHTVDAIIKCNVDQIEKLVPVMLDVPTPVAPRQRTKVEVPQMTHFGLHERFRWPTEQVLLISMGVVATPVGGTPNPLGLNLPGTMSNRADLLVLVESKGRQAGTPSASRSAQRDASSYRGRY